MQNNNKLNKNFLNKYGAMEVFYAILFWLIFILTIILTGIYFFLNDNFILKEFSLPLLALILTIGQLWQNESKNRFEKEKYKRSRKDLYFDKKVEIALGFNSYLEQLSAEISKPYFNQELLFDHQKFLFIQMEFYRGIVERAKFLFDDKFMDNVKKITDLTSNIQNEIQIMQNLLYISPSNRTHPNFILAQENYSKYYQELYNLTNEICTYMVKQINIKETVDA